MWRNQRSDFLDNKAACSFKSRLISAMIFTLLNLIAGGYFVLQPKQAELEWLMAEEMDKKNLILRQADTGLNNQSVLKGERYSQWMVEHRTLLLPDKELATVLATLNQLATDHHLRVVKLQWQERQASQPFDLLQFELEVTGSYRNIGYFSEQVNRLSYLLNFSTAEWASSDKNEGILRFRAKGYGYLRHREISP